MDNLQETLNTFSKVDSQPYAAERSAAGANDRSQQSQPSVLELNSILLIVMGGLAAIFTGAAFLISGH
jgi:hypothetical protein